MKDQEIKTMKLYHHVDRIERRLQDLGYSLSNQSELVDPERLGTVDSLHFFGDEPIQRILQLINASSGSNQDDANETMKVLDIGTGYGGTARLLAHRSGCRVDALELQPDLSAAGAHLTRKCGLDMLIVHKTGDFMRLPLVENEYDVVVGLLCFMHIGNWPQLFQRCYASLKAGGVMYVEDFFLRSQELTQDEHILLENDVCCSQLYKKDELMAVLTTCGFESIEFQDVTAKWVPYVVNRSVTYHANLQTHIASDGKNVAEDLDHFYASVAKVFQGNNLGGFTLVVRKPLSS
ncbi:Sterol 24-c-methyltransferase, partial [Globisporangium splendens]